MFSSEEPPKHQLATLDVFEAVALGDRE